MAEGTIRPMAQRIHLGGTPIDVISAEHAALLVSRRLKDGLRTTVAPVNAAIVDLAANSPDVQRIFERFDLVLADGLWVALAATCLFRIRVHHANTLPFIRTLFQCCTSNDLKVFLLGARADVVKRAAASVHHLHHNVTVVGYRDGYFKSDEQSSIVDIINKSGANILLVGTSSPKKELFIQQNWGELTVSIGVGVGGLFDIWAGDVREAPTWIRKVGFEWIVRLCQEPRRLWKRYTISNLRFIVVVLNQAFAMLFRT
jgi:N-acetylglucosaminyldiphosphoundecaprenol N-acetyl-beta-D-mannosaminyltransferase